MTPLPPLERDLPPLALQVLAAATRHDTPCEGGTLVWHTWGEGPPLVLLHGGSGSWTHWLRNVQSLAASGRRVVVPDLPAFGDSAAPPGVADADRVAPLLAASLRSLLGDGPLDVVGFSFGGLVAGLMADTDQSLVRRLVLVGAPGMGLRAQRLPLRAWRGLEDPAARAAAHRQNLATLMFAREASIDDSAIALQAANVTRDRMQRRRLALTDILVRTLPRLACRVDAIYGEHDALYRDTLDALRTLLAAAPAFGEFIAVPGAGHWVQYEEPAAFDAALLHLLAR